VKVIVIGSGYVGLTTGLCLAYVGHDVACTDLDEERIDCLQRGLPPFHEPGLLELMHATRDRMRYATHSRDLVAEAEVIFLAVGTPPLPDGTPDLRYLRAAGEEIGRSLSNSFAVVVNKSTVPIGSAHWMDGNIRDAYSRQFQRPANGNFAVASNPEFLREGSAIRNSLYPDRIVIGFDNQRVLNVLNELYRPILEQSFVSPHFASRPEGFGAVPLVTVSLTSAELIKYAANAFLSLKISFANEIGCLAERVGGDITQIMRGIGLDERIGSRFLQAGLGWGGSCFGKDTAALIATGREYGLDMQIVQAARHVNYCQREHLVEKLRSELKILKGRTIGVLGLAFKPDTDDLRDSPALDVIHHLVERGVRVRAHDPVAIAKAKRANNNPDIQFCDSVECLVNDCDALVLATDWKDYRYLCWSKLASKMRNPIVIDGRNCLDRAAMESAGFRYIGMGI
jgi:UDPglucose 6-dehydrogenase